MPYAIAYRGSNEQGQPHKPYKKRGLRLEIPRQSNERESMYFPFLRHMDVSIGAQSWAGLYRLKIIVQLVNILAVQGPNPESKRPEFVVCFSQMKNI